MQYAGFTEVVQQTSNQLRAGDPPEIVMGNMAIAGSLFLEDQLAPVTGLADEVYSGPEEFLLKPGDGEAYTLCPSWVPHHMNFRRDKLEEAGISPPSDRVNHDLDWDDLADWFVAIDEETDMDAWGYSSQAGTRGTTSGLSLFLQNGCEVFEGTDEVVLDQGQDRERAIEALEHFRDDRLPYATGGSDIGWSDIQEIYVNGVASSIEYGWGRPASILFDRGETEKLENTMPLIPPHNNLREDEGLVEGNFETFSLIESSENIEAAKEWLRLFYTTDELFVEFLHSVPMYKLPPNNDLLTSDMFLDNDLADARPDVVDFYSNLLESGHLFEHIAGMGGVGFNAPHSQASQAGEYGIMLQKIAQQNKEPATVVDETANALREYL
jgi:ABC-type glycerol-3-phosphate transport system substrate-binding protein